MSSEEEQRKQGEGIGFAGLSSMVSDVDATLACTPKQPQGASSDSSSQQSAQASRPAHQEQPRPAPLTSQAPAQPSGVLSAAKWLFGIATVIAVIWLANQSGNNSSPRPAYSPGSSSTSVAPAPAGRPPAAKPQVPSRPSEDKPSVGRNNVLSNAQIRYCLAEKIRLDAAETVINNYVDSDVDRFNGHVADYNSRCGEFRHRQGTLESARRDVEPYRGQLQAEGRSRFVRSSSVATRLPTPAQAPPARPAPDEMVQVIQHRLNDLGYDAGTEDGFYGGKTRAAIQAYQRDNGIVTDGEANVALLRQLGTAAQQGGSSWSPPADSKIAQFRAPDNSIASGSEWFCKSGYKKVGYKCVSVYER